YGSLTGTAAVRAGLRAVTAVVADERRHQAGEREPRADLHEQPAGRAALDAQREPAHPDPEGRGQRGEERDDHHGVVPRRPAPAPGRAAAAAGRLRVSARPGAAATQTATTTTAGTSTSGRPTRTGSVVLEPRRRAEEEHEVARDEPLDLAGELEDVRRDHARD